MKRNIALFVVLLSLATWARQLTPQEALDRMSDNAASSRIMDGNGMRQLKLIHTESYHETNYFYVYETAGSGDAVFVAADDLLPPILAYGINSFDANNMPPQMREWIKFYRNVSSNVISNGTPLKLKVSGLVVQPLLGTYWDQREPYNNLCKEKLDADMPTGCVATAMAQVMNYWRHPEHGIGSHSYTATGGILLNADFGSTYYDWNNMSVAYGTYVQNGTASYMHYSNAQAMAVATLMYHCGVSVEMNYGIDGSGSDEIKAGAALVNYFGYSKSIRHESRDVYSDMEWEQLLYDELTANRPIIYCGATVNNEGHCFVCDGSDGNGYFHFNWGWSGNGDGYYLVTGNDALHPTNQGTGGSLMSDAFDQSQTILTNIKPHQPEEIEEADVKMKAGGIIETEQGIVCAEVLNSDQTTLLGNVTRGNTYILNGGFWNSSLFPINAELGVILHNTQTDAEYICDATLSTGIRPNYGYNYYSFNVDVVPENGTYEVYPAYLPLNEIGIPISSWKRMSMLQGTTAYKINVSGTTPMLRVTDIKLSEEEGVISTSPTLDISFKALKSGVNSKNITAYIYEWNGTNFVNYYTTSLSLSKDASKTVSLTPKQTNKLEEGKAYRLEITSRNIDYDLGDMEKTKIFFYVGTYTPTGIETISEMTGRKPLESQVIYDLSGRKVNDTSLPGIYIRNGRKIIKQ